MPKYCYRNCSLVSETPDEPTDTAVKRNIEDNVFPKTVDITPDPLKVAMTTQIAIGNLAKQPVYEKFVEQVYIIKALQARH
jgi:NitT/TauT family transport system substrate-binding protein